MQLNVIKVMQRTSILGLNGFKKNNNFFNPIDFSLEISNRKM